MDRKSTGRRRSWSRHLPASKHDLWELGDEIMAAIDDLQAEVEETKTVTQSAIVLLQGLKERLDAAGTDPIKLKALSDDLDSNSKALAAAVTANTPAEPQP